MTDYYLVGLAKCICIVLSLLPTIYASHNDRDIILTPNKTQQHAGKIIYFKPFDKDSTSKQRSLKENVHTTQVPWEEPLKHATYLVLNNKIDGNDDSSGYMNETRLQAAAYKRGAYKTYQKFGDIVSLARGRLETDENNDFVFIEMDLNECKKLNCSLNGNDDKNITAFWLVEKVRHRDEKQGHRYELRILRIRTALFILVFSHAYQLNSLLNVLSKWLVVVVQQYVTVGIVNSAV